ncbi:hypothetical protein A9K55_000547 [Cordyceps militaris]|uniref:Uncharacterized protein n=1 Tax=Cordyceps militaris TaxID=73501 RepID=A0A2H4SUM1_CORMI|nr:hypothetical protein A9K55_000547 [Cordyceps militaris]
MKNAEIPGLTKPLTLEDLQDSRAIYNELPDDAAQPVIPQAHIEALSALFVRHGVHDIFGIHLIHAHFKVPAQSILLGSNYDQPPCRWAKTTTTTDIDLSSIHGHIFVHRNDGFHAYEYQQGPPPNLSNVGDTFFQELAHYLAANDLSNFLGLQIIDANPTSMLELILPQATVMLRITDVSGCISTRQTGWRFEMEQGKVRVCQANESHGQKANTHEIYNKGDAHPRMETYEDLKKALVQFGILCA